MPARDGTGPDGKGPRTGRGLGNCPPRLKPEKDLTDRPNDALSNPRKPIRRRRRRHGRERNK